MRILYVVGTRPNFVKTAPVIAAMRSRLPEGRHVIVHTGQHYDRLMSEIFLDELGVPAPDHMLEVGSGTHAQQTARTMERLEPVIQNERPDLVVVPGDVNSTLAAVLTAVKMEVPVAHVESGLRSFDLSMPEEVNRIVADRFSSHLFLHSEDAIDNLRAEGVGQERMHFVGNTMIDTLVALEERIAAAGAAAKLDLSPGSYLLVTLHRPALVDGPLLAETVAQLSHLAREMPVVFPVHPRTRKMMEAAGDTSPAGLILTEPFGYLDFLSLLTDARAVLTDSGGIQEETTYLGVPCFTLRANTERPVTVELGTNRLLGLDPAAIAQIPATLAISPTVPPEPPPLWDGHAAERIADILAPPDPELLSA
ncbi:MAG TPA: UDP-N-acetylglucosamine 2-epimerase (non-hydrolyzing) [Solirubrobacterales bacterium]|jgi:UDP-N-acetylglucosamine 2-epimerase (non-hydrolysing)|nr:UDP-N-acetylglucosamine 2-epimerase (non-hydrolyzing) [Solirubrobacterales bacterium]